jgi:hypothetical protein
MSWWDDGDDVLGDGPADAITVAWQRILAGRGHKGQPLPTTTEALESYAAALGRTKVVPPFGSMVLCRDSDRVAEFTGSGGVGDLTDAFAEAMLEMVQEYQEDLERSPRPSEIIKTLDFVIRPSPETYLSDTKREEWEYLRLEAG